MAHMQPEILVLGVDGGGTATRAVILDQEGTVRGFGRGGPANPRVVGDQGALQSVMEAVSAARAQSGLREAQFAAAHLGHAGLGQGVDRDAFLELARDLGLAAPETVSCGHDMEIAFEGGLAGTDGVVLVCGTGSSCWGRAPGGITARAGGWGWMIDDPGSGYWFGIQALRAAMRAWDGRAPNTPLAEEARLFFGLDDLSGIARRLYTSRHGHSEVAALAPTVFRIASQGDPAARAIVAEAASELALMVSTVADRIGLGERDFPVALAGGILRGQPTLFRQVSDTLRIRHRRVQVVEPLLPPSVGAAMIALRHAGISMHGTLRLQIQESAGTLPSEESE